MQSSRSLFIVLLVAICAAGVVLVLYSTIWGPGLFSDSFQYISSAQNIAAGKGVGYSIGSRIFPLTHYPPLYPLALSPFALAGINAIDGARWLNALLLGLSILLVGASAWVITRSAAFSLLGACLAALSPALIGVHTWALSEPLYIFLSLACLLCLGLYLAGTPTRAALACLLASALLGSLAFLTRYVGLALLLTGVLGIALLSTQGWKRRSILLLTWAAIVGLPSAAWMLRNYFLSGTLTDRALVFNLLTRKNLGMVVNTLSTWFLPARLVNGRELYLGIGLALLALGVGVFAAWYFTRAGKESRTRLAGFHPAFWLQAIQVPVYLGVLLLSKSLFDEGIGMSARILSPIYLPFIILMVGLLHRLWSTRGLAGKLIALGICAYLLLFTTSGGIAAVNVLHADGPGGARARLSSDSIAFLRSADDYPIYTNSPSSVYLRTGKTGLSLGSFRHKLEAGSLEPDVYLVIFKHVPRGQDLPEVQGAGLAPLVDDAVASIYLYHR